MGLFVCGELCAVCCDVVARELCVLCCVWSLDQCSVLTIVHSTSGLAGLASQVTVSHTTHPTRFEIREQSISPSEQSKDGTRGGSI